MVFLSPKKQLRSGRSIPVLGLGTWLSNPGEVGQAVQHAIKIGVRHIDCAWTYKNEKEVGEAIKKALAENDLKREELFVTSKLWNDFHDPAVVEKMCRESLANLGLEYLDLYLIHWPVCTTPGSLQDTGKYPLEETFKALIELKKKNLVKSIGVSNFSKKKLKKLIDFCKAENLDLPEVNQVEMNPYLTQNELVQYCKEENVVITAYSPLGNPGRADVLKTDVDMVLLEDPLILKLSEKYQTSPAGICISWALRRELVVIPKSVKNHRIEENFIKVLEIFKSISEEDIERITELDKNFRIIIGHRLVGGEGYKTVMELWDDESLKNDIRIVNGKI